ncbi:glutamine synthetase [Rhodobacterales bacterium HKCCE3408]|nr:glutamine synthetase [Rhodobacterales bacterium HKCCE3408]
MTFEELKAAVAEGRIDTVLVTTIDMQGRIMGKRFAAGHFVEHGYEETHCCAYLVATDLEMATPPGYANTSWEKGYGDYALHPDLSTIRPVPWLEATAIVLCDIIDPETGKPVPMAPRQILKQQIERCKKMGFTPVMAAEMELFLFRKSFEALRDGGYRDLEPFGSYNEDYHIFQTTKEEGIMRPIRNHLRAMGVPVESTKGEAEAGQVEINIRYAEALECADNHVLAKHAVKEIAWMNGHAATFLAKWSTDRVGSSSHVHQSLWKDGKNVFHDPAGEYGMSDLLRHYIAGLIEYASDITWFLAPYVNSYKRFARGTFAPTKAVWSVDNRTAAFRLVGENTKAVRIECRIAGADLNPYLALAAQLAAGLAGIEQKLELEEPYDGNVYRAGKAAEDIPRTLRKATEAMRNSAMLKAAMGEDVIAHYTRAAEWEQEEFDRAVTDWEIARGFERA